MLWLSLFRLLICEFLQYGLCFYIILSLHCCIARNAGCTQHSSLDQLLQTSKYHRGNVVQPEISLSVSGFFILLCFASPQLNEYFLIQIYTALCDETLEWAPVNCGFYSLNEKRRRQNKFEGSCVDLAVEFGLENGMDIKEIDFFFFIFFRVPGTFLLFLWVKTWEASFLGIAEGKVSRAQDGNMGDLLAEL